MAFKNKELKGMMPKIIGNKIEFRKGTVSGNSIEIQESEPESHTSFTYYEDEEGRDRDFEMLRKIAYIIM